MDLSALQDYVVVIVMGICVCVGYILKKLRPAAAVKRFIPLIMGVLGILLNMWVNWSITPEVVLGGLVSGLASTGLYEAMKNMTGGSKKE